MTIRETALTEDVLRTLIALSEAWEAENSCFGYRANRKEDIEGNRVFLAVENGETLGYLFGKVFLSRNMRSIMPEGTKCFEIEELYVVPWRRSEGVGKALAEYAMNTAAAEADYAVLSTATKNWRAVFHFYLDELGMEFWSARLFKKIGKSPIESARSQGRQR